MQYLKNIQSSQNSQLINLFVFANNSLASKDVGMSGGDRIFINLLTGLSKNNYHITLFCGKNIQEIFENNNCSNIDYITYKNETYSVYKTDLITIFKKLVYSVLAVFKYGKASLPGLIYITSDFWPDLLPALFFKLINNKYSIVASFFQFVSPPWEKTSPYKGKRIVIGLLYYFSQIPAYLIIKILSRLVLITSAPDQLKFISFGRKKEDVYIVKGGVDIDEIQRYKKVIKIEKNTYDAVFSGRLHSQKGLSILLSIWLKLLKRKPNARLIIIGNGPMEQELKQFTKVNNIEKNVDFAGFKDGLEKYKIFVKSRIIVHPATYDSGGMAAAEAMAWGLPGISFDLESLKTYYPKGVIKVPCFNEDAFVDKIFELLTNKTLYRQISNDAESLIYESWSWKIKNKEFNNLIQKYVK
jgi:glycosyltransferase involved in cell wall biosynthesis